MSKYFLGDIQPTKLSGGNTVVYRPSTGSNDEALKSDTRGLWQKWEDIVNNPNEKVNINQNGVVYSSGSTTLDKILATFTSVFALSKGAAYVPTTTIPQNQYGGYNQQYDAATLQLLAQQQAGLNTGGQIQNWIQQNTGVVLIGAAILAAYLIQSPRSRR